MNESQTSGAFTPVEAGLGGFFLLAAVFFVLWYNGRVSGISGIYANVVTFNIERFWARFLFLIGILGGGRLLLVIYPAAFAPLTGPVLGYVLSGFLVGFGTQMGTGCTSGHMLCGISRLSKRSILATFVFFSTAIVIANVFKRGDMSEHAIAPLELPPMWVVYLMLTSTGLMLGVYAIIGLLGGRWRVIPTGLALHFNALFSGGMFAVGLGFSGMTKPSQVLGFLTVWGVWNPSLAVLAVVALVPNIVLYFTVIRHSTKPLLDSKYAIPTATNIDVKLVLGAAIFGSGWGWSGFCPGPALTNAARFEALPWIFVGSMTAGMLLYKFTVVAVHHIGVAIKARKDALLLSNSHVPSDAPPPTTV